MANTTIKPATIVMSNVSTKRSFSVIWQAVINVLYTAAETANSTATMVNEVARIGERTAIASGMANETWASTWVAEQQAAQIATIKELNS